MASRPRRKKQYLAQQTGKQKELRQPNAEEYRAAIESAVQKQLPQVVQSASVQEQSLHIGPLPPADEAKNIRNFSLILWIGRWRLPKDCKKRI